MKLSERVERSATTWLQDRARDRMLHRFGGIQNCCWCRQCAQGGDGWNFQTWQRDPFLDVLECGVCGGTSLWRWEVGMIFIGPLEPPKSAYPAVPYYNVTEARLA